MPPNLNSFDPGGYRFSSFRCERHAAGGEETHRRNHFHSRSLGGALNGEEMGNEEGFVSTKMSENQTKTCVFFIGSIGFWKQCEWVELHVYSGKMQAF